MHELSLCCSIYDIVDRAREGRQVTTVELTVGQLRQVVPETLADCWEVVTATTPLAGSRLRIEHVPGRLACPRCSAVTTLDTAFVFACAQCGALEVTVESGDELTVTAVDLVDVPAAGPDHAMAEGKGADG